MRVNALPGSDIKISEISFGAGTAAGLMVNGARDAQRDAVEAALEHGINHFDTAPIYGFGCSEVNLGAVLNEIGADVVVTSKFNLTPQYLVAGDIAARVQQSVTESLTRLHRDHLDFLLIHNATHFKRNLDHLDGPDVLPQSDLLPHVSLDDLLGEGGVIETVERLKEKGLVRAFGVSGQDNDPLAVRALVATDLISVFNQPFNLMNPSAGFSRLRRGERMAESFVRQQADYIDFDDVIDFAQANRVGVSVISPVAAGLLTESALAGQPAPEVSERAARFPRPGQYETELALARRFLPLARKYGISITEMAYRFAMSAPGVTTVVGGFSSAEQVREVGKAASRGPLPDDLLAELYGVWFG